MPKIQQCKFQLKKRGWCILEPEKLSLIEKIKNKFLKRISEANLKKLNTKNINLLRKTTAKLNSSEKNNFISIDLGGFPEMTLQLYKKQLIGLFGRKVFLQKRPQLQCNTPYKKNETYLMPAHADAYDGNSPHTFTLWFPLHDIEDNSGVYLWDLNLSNKFVLSLNNFQNEFDENDVINRYPPKKIKLGQCLLFSSLNIHGPAKNNNNLSRLSFDFRFNKVNLPLYEKYIEYFKLHKIN